MNPETLTTFQYADIGPYTFHSGESLPNVRLAYETYGTLNAQKNNAVLIFHALSGSCHVAGYNPTGPNNRFWNAENNDDTKHGWWNYIVGDKKAIDTRHLFVICINWVGGCYGSTGPSSINPATNRPYGGDFPRVQVMDVVDTQIKLLDQMGIRDLVAVIGPSMGGMAVSDFAHRYPDRARTFVSVSSTLRADITARMNNYEQIRSVVDDKNFQHGHYYDGEFPNHGLKRARMNSHRTFFSLEHMAERAAHEIQQPEDLSSVDYQLQHPIESYLDRHATRFVHRFDPNSYLRIASMWSSFDMTNPDLYPFVKGRKLFDGLNPDRHRFLILSTRTDHCIFDELQTELNAAISKVLPSRKNKKVQTITNDDEAGMPAVDPDDFEDVPLRFIIVHSEDGHDYFLTQPHLVVPPLREILKHTHPPLVG